MGIKGLGKFLSEYAPKAVKQQDVSSLLGRIIAIDASMSLYQFMIAIRDGDSFSNLTNEAGEVTSHISGFISRVLRLLECGIKPVYVFDGKPTQLKSGELAKRTERRMQAEADLEEAQEIGDRQEIKKYMGRTVKVTRQHNEDVKHLLRLMGMPVVDAPTEAEAQCARMAASGLVYGTATEDADALTFGSPILIRHLHSPDAHGKGKGIKVFNLQSILEELELTMGEFVDFCILCGCDYCDRLKGIGPNTAYKLIKQHKSIENVLEHLSSKDQVPADYNFVDARQFFLQPEVTLPENLEKLIWTEPQETQLREFLIEKNNFAVGRVESYITRLRNAKAKSSQMRLEHYFGPTKIHESLKSDSKKKTVSIKGISKSAVHAAAKVAAAGSKRKSITHVKKA